MNTMNTIHEFTNHYRFLSNFWPAIVELDGEKYPSVEHAYQAAKVPRTARTPFTVGSAFNAKRLGREVPLCGDWNGRKVEVMRKLIAQKFAPGTILAKRLIDTGDAYIKEGNTWGDTFWGICNDVGQNQLGKLLMEQREILRKSAS